MEETSQNHGVPATERAAFKFKLKALSSMLVTVIKDLYSKDQDTLQSQDQLASSIDLLTRELDQLLVEDAPLPFVMQYAANISGVRMRVSSLNSVLKSIHRRVDSIDRMLSVGLCHGLEIFSSNLTIAQFIYEARIPI